MDCAYFTLVSKGYVKGAVCLIKSLKRFTEYPIWVMSIDLDEDDKQLLHDLGAKIWEGVPRITSKLAKVRPWHPHDQFCQYCFYKINMWSTQWDKIIYLDSDIIVLKDIDHLFKTEAEFSAVSSCGLSIDVSKIEGFTGRMDVKDIPAKAITPHFSKTNFNAGVLVISPNKIVYDKMMSLKDTLVPDSDPSDQGFLNEYYKDRWNKLDTIYNTSRRVFLNWREKFEEIRDNIHVIHFTGSDSNPWFSNESERDELENLWWEYYERK